jgi:hypothetical protein
VVVNRECCFRVLHLGPSGISGSAMNDVLEEVEELVCCSCKTDEVFHIILG